MLLPCFLILLLLALQPACLLYTRAVMESAAGETARVLATGGELDVESCRAFALRRLEAVPNVSIFHEGGPMSWDIDLDGAGGASGVSVAIEGSVRPLPVLGAFASAFGKADATGGVRIRVEVSYASRPAWLEGDYGAWVSAWG